MLRKPIRKISEKRMAQLPQYRELIEKLRGLCHRSELSGDAPDWQSNYQVEPHHIRGRTGGLLLDPYNIILLTRTEHDIEQGKVAGQKVGEAELLRIVRAIRVRQGFKETGQSQ